MNFCRFMFIISILLFIQKDSWGKLHRSKRCIVVQKQTGTHGDSNEDGDDGDYRKPEVRPSPKRHHDREYLNNFDEEIFTPELITKNPPYRRTYNDKLRKKTKTNKIKRNNKKL